jgi:hypothetical protein
MRSRNPYRTLLALSLLAAVVADGAAAQEPAAETYSLGQAMQTALANSQTIEDAEYSFQIAKEQVKEAWGSAVPCRTSSPTPRTHATC